MRGPMTENILRKEFRHSFTTNKTAKMQTQNNEDELFSNDNNASKRPFDLLEHKPLEYTDKVILAPMVRVVRFLLLNSHLREHFLLDFWLLRFGDLFCSDFPVVRC